MAMNAAGTLPAEVAKELARRNAADSTHWERIKAQSNPKQLPLPFNNK